MRFEIWRLRVCLYSFWYLLHWPWNDVSEFGWCEMFEYDDDPWDAFLEGWCRE